MSTPHKPNPAKLVIGLIMQNRGLITVLTEELIKKFGPVDIVGPWFSFDFTDYYASELGTPLHRRVLSFEQLIAQNDLAGIKTATNRIEQRHANGTDRRVNIDPGYMTHERFVLATAKNFSHRIYLEKGIYADLTLIYTKGLFRALPWTYPDYQARPMMGFLEKIREKYIADFKAAAETNGPISADRN